MKHLSPYLLTRADGEVFLAAHAWPGGYPLYYVDSAGEILCPACASRALFSDYERERPVDGDVYWEGPPLTCADCSVEIASAYGDAEQEEEPSIAEQISSGLRAIHVEKIANMP